LESSRDKTRAKLRLANILKRGSAIFLIALTASVTVIVAAHAIVLLVATPGLIAASFELASVRSLARVTAQLDAAAKGTYILNRDMDTISRLVARLNDELEHMRAMLKFWVERKEDRLQASDEVARQLKKNDCSFSQQLDELEEHLYLCSMTVNRARNLVVKEMVDPGQPTTWP
jgi:methyl-accepting chemotaxis protein